MWSGGRLWCWATLLLGCQASHILVFHPQAFASPAPSIIYFIINLEGNGLIRVFIPDGYSRGARHDILFGMWSPQGHSSSSHRPTS